MRVSDTLPGHVDGVGRPRLPSLLAADVLGGLHHILCGLVVLQRPLVDRYLAILQYANLNVCTSTHGILTMLRAVLGPSGGKQIGHLCFSGELSNQMPILFLNKLCTWGISEFIQKPEVFPLPSPPHAACCPPPLFNNPAPFSHLLLS